MRRGYFFQQQDSISNTYFHNPYSCPVCAILLPFEYHTFFLINPLFWMSQSKT
jgi:hypothetical protein